MVIQNYWPKERVKPKFKKGDLAKTADKNDNFSECDTRICSEKLYTNTEAIDDTIPTYHINNLPER